MKRVAQYDVATGALLAVFPSLKAAAASIFHANPGNICACCKGRRSAAYGYMWKYFKITKRIENDP